MESRIIKFLKNNTVMTLATSSVYELWCSNLFYAYDPKRNWLIFTSSPSTRHIREAMQSPKVSCAIYKKTAAINRLRGAQISGILYSTEDDEFAREICKEIFMKKFPFSSTQLKEMWYIDILTVKYTDNRLGFGTKLYYPTDEDL